MKASWTEINAPVTNRNSIENKSWKLHLRLCRPHIHLRPDVGGGGGRSVRAACEVVLARAAAWLQASKS